MVGHPTRQQAVAISRRRQEAFELRLAGIDFATIGRKLAADPIINSDGLAYPQGYGCDRYATGVPPPDEDDLAELVAADLRRAMRARWQQSEQAATDLRDVQHARLERLFVVAWRQALSGELEAVDRALRILEREARLFGLDAPVRNELSGSVGQVSSTAVLATHRQAAMDYLGELGDAIEDATGRHLLELPQQGNAAGPAPDSDVPG